jgi:hypothetical protein
MRTERWRLMLVSSALLAMAGCASSEEWDTWKSHPTHFASGSHMGFSMRNRADGKARVTRQDIASARDEGWWGRPITVGQEQILER